MTYNISGGAILSQATNITGNTAVDVYGPAPTSTVILAVVCTETGNVTPNLTIAKVNAAGTVTINYRFQKAMLAKETVVFDTPIVLKTGWKLRVTSSTATGLVDVDVSYLAPDKSSQGTRGGAQG